MKSYRSCFFEQVRTVRLFDGAKQQPLEKVFVELTITEEYERPLIHTAWLSLVDAELRRKRDVLAGEERSRNPSRRRRSLRSSALSTQTRFCANAPTR